MRDYKRIIENMLKKINWEDRKNIIETMLKSDRDQYKITEEEYAEYKEFFDQKLKEMEEKEMLENQEIEENQEKEIEEEQEKETESKSENKVVAIQAREEFKIKMRVEQKDLKFIPIYKGQMGKLPPRRQNEDNTREAR